MTRQRVIIGIGEALLGEYPDRIEPDGLALKCALAARQIGHRGIPVSRLGQDLAANELLTQLKAADITVDHLQSDPDLPTGRRQVRSIAGKTKRTLQPHAAFDNLQWDFDLVDLAQQADAVVFGMLAQREGQSRSVIKQFLAECANSIRVLDLVNRADDAIDRMALRASLEHAEGVVVDPIGLKALMPAWDGQRAHGAAAEILRDGQLVFVITIEPGDGVQNMTMHAGNQSIAAPSAFPAAQHEAAVVGALHGILHGWDAARTMALARAAAEHAATSPDQPMPRDLL